MKKEIKQNKDSNLSAAEAGKEYIIRDIATDDEELNSFLFSLGWYSGEAIAIVRKLKGSMVVSIKDGRYNIDNELPFSLEQVIPWHFLYIR